MPAHVADEREAGLPGLGARSHRGADGVGAREQGAVLERVEHGVGGGQGHRVAAVGAAETAHAGRVHDLGAAGDPGQGQAARDGLRGHEQVGHDAGVLAGEELARAAEAGLHLVGDEQDAVLLGESPEPRQVLAGRHHEAALAEHRLHDHRRHLLGGHVALEEVLEGVHAGDAAAPGTRGCTSSDSSRR